MIIINNQKSRLHLIVCNRNKNQGYISLHVTEINDLHCMHCTHIARHFMHHFTSFHVAFRIISCHISYISLYASHTSHAYHTCRVFREQRAFHALHHTSRHFMYHFMSFCHENSYYTHSYHLGVKREENRSKHHTLQLSACQVRRSIQEDKNAT